MIRIFVVAPYREFAVLFQDMAAAEARRWPEGGEDSEYTLDVVVNYDQDEIRKMRPTGDVVIARGNSALLLKNSGLPVVEVPVLPSDIIRCIRKVREVHGRKKVVFFGTAPIILHARSLPRILDWEMEVVEIPVSEAGNPERSLAKVANHDCVVIDGQAICRVAEKRGYPNFMVETGPEAIQTALAEARRIAHVRRAEQEKAQRFKTILDCNAAGIIAFDRKDRITSINAMAEKILSVSSEAATGRNLADLHPGTELCAFLDETPQCVDEVARLHEVPLVVNKTGTFLDGERIGSVVTLQYVTKIQDAEKKIRDKIAERGLMARHVFSDILGNSAAIRDAVATARKYSGVAAGVLIIGQSGTGKELFAQSIHNENPRQRHPFLAVNCAAIPESLLESELFGYVEDAFTGASKGGKPGLFELAHRGTLFLDEIG